MLYMTNHAGFNPSFLNFFRDDTQFSSCRQSIDLQQRVIVEDVRKSAIFVGTPSLKAMVEAKVLAVQSTPLISSAGHALGVLSTHFSSPSRPTEQEIRLMDLLARQAADYLERKRVEEEKEELLEREHDLRNPLNVILGYAELLLRSEEIKNSTPLRRMADAVKRNAVAQSKLIRDL